MDKESRGTYVCMTMLVDSYDYFRNRFYIDEKLLRSFYDNPGFEEIMEKVYTEQIATLSKLDYQVFARYIEYDCLVPAFFEMYQDEGNNLKVYVGHSSYLSGSKTLWLYFVEADRYRILRILG